MFDSREFPQHPDMNVYLQVDDERSIQGLVIQQETKENGALALVDFQLSEAPRLPIGAQVALLLHGEDLPTPTEVFGEVVYRSENPLNLRYQFRFDRDARDVLAGIGDRRRAVRVSPDPDEPVRATLEAHGVDGVIATEVLNISARGVSLLLARSEEARLFSSSHLRLTLQMPGEDEALYFQCFVRYRGLQEDQVKYGIEFDRDGTEDFDGQQEHVALYVLGRQSQQT